MKSLFVAGLALVISMAAGVSVAAEAAGVTPTFN